MSGQPERLLPTKDGRTLWTNETLIDWAGIDGPTRVPQSRGRRRGQGDNRKEEEGGEEDDVLVADPIGSREAVCVLLRRSRQALLSG